MFEKRTCLIIEDHSLTAHGLKILLTQNNYFSQVDCVASGLEAVAYFADHNPDVVIMDYLLPDFSGLDLLGEIKTRSVDSKTVVITGSEDLSWLSDIIPLKPDGILLKSGSISEMNQALEAVFRGEIYFSKSIVYNLSKQVHDLKAKAAVEDCYVNLTERENLVLDLVQQGKSNKEIAIQLQCSEYTVKTHKANLARKLKKSPMHNA